MRFVRTWKEKTFGDDDDVTDRSYHPKSNSFGLFWYHDDHFLLSTYSILLCCSHCSKSSFFVQKFNFDFLRKLSILFRLKNSWKCCDFRLFSCWQLWFHEKNCRFFWWKIRENVVVLALLAVDNFDFTKKIVKKNLGEKLVKMLGICTF